MDFIQILQWVLLVVLAVGGIYLILNNNLLFGTIAIVVFLYVLWTLFKPKEVEEKRRLSRKELIDICVVHLEQFFRISVARDGGVQIYDDRDYGDRWRFVFMCPSEYGGMNYYPVEIDTYDGIVGEKAGVVWDRINSVEHFLNRDSGQEQRPNISPEQVAELKESMGQMFEDAVERRRMQDGGEE